MKTIGTIRTCEALANGRCILTLETGREALDRYDIEKDLLLDIETKKHSDRRTLQANKYFHLLSNKIADVMRLQKPRVKNWLLYLYGQPLLDEEGNRVTFTTSDDSVSFWLNNEMIHCWQIAADGDAKMIVLEHSADLTADQFSVLIDGTVQEAKDLGIETETPEAIHHMIELLRSNA